MCSHGVCSKNLCWLEAQERDKKLKFEIRLEIEEIRLEIEVWI